MTEQIITLEAVAAILKEDGLNVHRNRHDNDDEITVITKDLNSRSIYLNDGILRLAGFKAVKHEETAQYYFEQIIIAEIPLADPEVFKKIGRLLK